MYEYQVVWVEAELLDNDDLALRATAMINKWVQEGWEFESLNPARNELSATPTPGVYLVFRRSQ